jgi:hypothetical protein
MQTAASFASDLNAFLADDGHAPIELRCVTQYVNGMNMNAFPFVVLGWVILILLFAPFSQEVTAVLDRRAGTIESKGRAWLQRSWNVKRPLRDVAQIDVGSVYGGYGSRRYLVYARFHDGSRALLWSPAYATLDTINDRVRQMKALVKGS